MNTEPKKVQLDAVHLILEYGVYAENGTLLERLRIRGQDGQLMEVTVPQLSVLLANAQAQAADVLTAKRDAWAKVWAKEAVKEQLPETQA